MVRPNKPRTVGGESNLAVRIARERERLGLSYEALAKAMTDAGCSIAGSAIFKIEKSKPPRRITVDEMLAFAGVFGLSVDDLLTPVDLLDKERARELVDELDEAQFGLIGSVNKVVKAYAEFEALADPELRTYVTNYLRAQKDDRLGPRGQAELQLVDRDRLPDYDQQPLADAVTGWFERLYQEGTAIAVAYASATPERKKRDHDVEG